MSVYNGAAYLRPAIESILAQTFADFEFLIVDDASTDDSVAIIESYHDPRIVLIRNEQNSGLAASLNRIIDQARGTYLARMDADDVSLPERLATQVTFLESHPDVVLVGSFAQIMNSSLLMRQPTTHDTLAPHLLFRTSFIHPTVVFRRAFLMKHALRYDTAFRQTQDYELFTRIARIGTVANIPKVLLLYRQHEKQASHEKLANQIENARTIMRREFETFGLSLTEEELDLVAGVKRFSFASLPHVLERLSTLFTRIMKRNEEMHRYTEAGLREVLGEIWLQSAISLSRNGIEVRRDFLMGTPRRWITPTPRNFLRALRLLIVGPHSLGK